MQISRQLFNLTYLIVLFVLFTQTVYLTPKLYFTSKILSCTKPDLDQDLEVENLEIDPDYIRYAVRLNPGNSRQHDQFKNALSIGKLLSEAFRSVH